MQSKVRKFLAWLFDPMLARMKAVEEAVPDHEPLPEDERPVCPYCERRLGVAPGYGSLAWKCARHGTFPAATFEANILRAMQADVE